VTLRNENVVIVESSEDKLSLRVVYRFPNGYGADIARAKSPIPFLGREYLTYTDKDTWELAVIRFNSEDNTDYVLVYNTPITDDVLGYLPDNEVNEILSQIEKLSIGLPEPLNTPANNEPA
jgi:hypothetical protein